MPLFPHFDHTRIIVEHVANLCIFCTLSHLSIPRDHQSFLGCQTMRLNRQENGHVESLCISSRLLFGHRFGWDETRLCVYLSEKHPRAAYNWVFCMRAATSKSLWMSCCKSWSTNLDEGEHIPSQSILIQYPLLGLRNLCELCN